MPNDAAPGWDLDLPESISSSSTSVLFRNETINGERDFRYGRPYWQQTNIWEKRTAELTPSLRKKPVGNLWKSGSYNDYLSGTLIDRFRSAVYNPSWIASFLLGLGPSTGDRAATT